MTGHSRKNIHLAVNLYFQSIDLLVEYTLYASHLVNCIIFEWAYTAYQYHIINWLLL